MLPFDPVPLFDFAKFRKVILFIFATEYLRHCDVSTSQYSTDSSLQFLYAALHLVAQPQTV